MSMKKDPTQKDAAKARKNLRLELPSKTYAALSTYCTRHECSLQAGIRKVLDSSLNVDGGVAGNA